MGKDTGEQRKIVNSNGEYDSLPAIHIHMSQPNPNKLGFRKTIAGFVLIGAAAVGAGLKLGLIEMPEAAVAKRTVSIDNIKSALSSQASVASGEIKSSADVHSSYSFLLGEASCDGEVKASQSFTVSADGNADNIKIDKKHKDIVINLDKNEATLGDQTIGTIDPKDCKANYIGRKFDDGSKAYKEAQKATGILSKRTEIRSVSELFALNDGQAGKQIAETEAATYDYILGSVIEEINPEYKLTYEYKGQPVFPDSTSNLSISRYAGKINADNL